MQSGCPTPDPETPDPASEDPSQGNDQAGAGSGPHVNAQWKGTREAIEQAGLRLEDVWLRYFSFSGVVGEYETDAYLHGSFALSAVQADLLAHAVNELIDEIPRPYAPYSRQEHQDVEERRRETREET
jgi:hypothetical protein